MTKEFLKEHNTEEVAKQFDQELRDFVNHVNIVESVETLDEMEQQLIKEQDEVNDYLKNVTYELADDVMFDGERYTLSAIAKTIVYFISKKEVEWKYTLGLYQLVKFWKSNNPKVVEYGTYDSTLRILNQLPYKGFNEWRDILACNEYFRTAHDDYSKDTSWLIFVSEKHNALMDRRAALEKLREELD